MSIEVKAAHDTQSLELWHDDGVEKLSIVKANGLIVELQAALKVLSGRKAPPAPAPWDWVDGEDAKDPFASSLPCTGQDESNEMHCGGGVGGHEFYLGQFVSLRDWLNKVIDYHRKENCKNLKLLEGDNAR